MDYTNVANDPSVMYGGHGGLHMLVVSHCLSCMKDMRSANVGGLTLSFMKDMRSTNVGGLTLSVMYEPSYTENMGNCTCG